MKRSLSLVGGMLAGTLLFAANSAHAHIKLLKPTSWLKDDANGGAQEKGGPCGPGGYDGLLGQTDTPSGVVTTFQAGETITVQWTEVIDHPGYFRIALAPNRADLKDPTVPFTDMSSCSVDHSKVPTGAHDNVLADGIYLTDTPSSRPSYPNYTYQVTLPKEPCDKCTLQVIQFMESHPPDCIYYHCADIKIVAGGATDGGTGSGDAAADASVAVDAGKGSDAGTTVATAGGAAGGSSTGSAVGGGVAGGVAGGSTVPTGSGTGTAAGTTGAAGGTTGGGATGGTTGTTTSGAVAGTPTSSDDSSGGCAVASGSAPKSATGLGLTLLGLALLLYRRRRLS